MNNNYELKVKDLDDTTTIQMTNELMVLTDESNNYVNNISITNFNANIISKDVNNIIEQGDDGGLYAETASITEDVTELSNSIGELDNLQTLDKSSIVNAINEISTTTINGANTDLSNLTSAGNAKFQYAPFSINNGTVDSNGNNVTLSTVGDVPVSIDKYVVPQLSSNTSDYGTCNDYTMTGTKSASFSNFTNPWTMQLNESNYIPSGATVTFTISTNNSLYNYAEGYHYYAKGCTGCTITYTYTDDTTENIFSENNTGNFASWSPQSGAKTATITLPVASKTVKAISVQGYKSTGHDYNYYNAWGITFRAQYTVSSADTLICSPCTITTADGRTQTFEYDNTLDCSSVTNGTYKVMKSYTDGSLSLVQNLTISKTNQQSETLWTQPVLSANGTMGGDSFAVAVGRIYNGEPYYVFNGDTTGNDINIGYTNANWGSAYQDDVWIAFYNPVPLKVTQLNFYDSGAVQTNGNGIVYGSNDYSNWEQITTFSFTYSQTSPKTVDMSSNIGYFKYYKIKTTGNTGHQYALVSYKEISITAYVGGSLADGDLWLDTSKYPLTLKRGDGVNWQINNDLVYIGDVTISNGIITAVMNNPFNWNNITGSSASMPSNRYVNLTLGANGSTYTAPADGYFLLRKIAGSDFYYASLTSSAGIRDFREAYRTSEVTPCIPVKRGEVITLTYNATGNTIFFRFYYA